jgi:hypothetical protein
MLALVDTLAGIAWTPTIRGILVVAVGVAVLMGSVYLLLSTNLGHRLGFLVALAGLFGWMTILGMFWWIKPSATGPAGRVPAWEVEEVNTGNLDQAILAKARALGNDLDNAELPSVKDLNDATEDDFQKMTKKVDEDLDGWTLIAPSDPARGEAQAVVDAKLIDGTYPGISATTDYLAQYAFETGGKPRLPNDPTRWDRISNKFTNTLRIFSPAHYVVIQACPTDPATRPEAAAPGAEPPTLACQPGAEPISVVLVRDLGERRLLPAVVTIASGLIFGLLCVMLHKRDQTVAEHLNAPLPAPGG